MSKILSAHIGDLLHKWSLDDGRTLMIRELPDGAGYIWQGRHYHHTISVELYDADGDQIDQCGLDYDDYPDEYWEALLEDVTDRILPMWNIDGSL